MEILMNPPRRGQRAIVGVLPIGLPARSTLLCTMVACLLWAVPVLAQTPDAATVPAEGAPVAEAADAGLEEAGLAEAGLAEAGLAETGDPDARELFQLLLADDDADAATAVLSRLVARHVQGCSRVTDYQVYRSGTGYRQLKIKCPEQPLFALSIDRNGVYQLQGGDGTVSPMAMSDGQIVTVFGVRAEEYMRQAARAGTDTDRLPETVAAAPLAPAANEPEEKSIMRRGWWLAIVAVNILLVGLFVWAALKFLRPGREAAMSGWRNLTSVEKDFLLDEAAEVLPEIFRHPGGIYIARGRRGKRRLFKSLFFAYLYANFGWKLGEID